LSLSNNVVASSTRKGIDDEVKYQELTVVVAVGNDNDYDQLMAHVAFPYMTRFQNLTRANDYAMAHDGDEQDGCVDEKENNNRSRRSTTTNSLQLQKLFFSLFDRQIPNSDHQLIANRQLSFMELMRQWMILDERKPFFL